MKTIKINIKQSKESLKRRMVYVSNLDVDEQTRSEMLALIEQCSVVLCSKNSDDIKWNFFCEIGLQSCLSFAERIYNLSQFKILNITSLIIKL